MISSANQKFIFCWHTVLQGISTLAKYFVVSGMWKHHNTWTPVSTLLSMFSYILPFIICRVAHFRTLKHLTLVSSFQVTPLKKELIISQKPKSEYLPNNKIIQTCKVLFQTKQHNGETFQDLNYRNFFALRIRIPLHQNQYNPKIRNYNCMQSITYLKQFQHIFNNILYINQTFKLTWNERLANFQVISTNVEHRTNHIYIKLIN